MEERSIEAAKQATGCGSAASASTWNPTLPQGVAVILFRNEVNTIPKWRLGSTTRPEGVWDSCMLV